MIFAFLSAQQRKSRKQRMETAAAKPHAPAKATLKVKVEMLEWFSRRRIKGLIRAALRGHR